ncbi:hypothetical protein NFI96_017931, partial [Prochilodus magdalenae]
HAALAVEREHLTRIGWGTPIQVQEPAEWWPEEEIPVTTSWLRVRVCSSLASIAGNPSSGFWRMTWGTMSWSWPGTRRESDDLSDTTFLKYAGFYPEVAKAMWQRSMLADDCLGGFGAHKMCPYKELYESMDREKKNPVAVKHVQWLRGKKSKPGTKMDALRKHIQKRDVDQKVNGSSSSAQSTSAPDSALPYRSLSKEQSCKAP